MFEIELIYYIKMDLMLNNLKRLICHKTNQPTNQPFSHISMTLITEWRKVHKKLRVLSLWLVMFLCFLSCTRWSVHHYYLHCHFWWWHIIDRTLTDTYIVIQQTDCFIVSQLFSEAKDAGHFKLGSKPAKLYARLSILLLSHLDDLRHLGN